MAIYKAKHSSYGLRCASWNKGTIIYDISENDEITYSSELKNHFIKIDKNLEDLDSLEELRMKFKIAYGKDVPVNKKNDKNWIGFAIKNEKANVSGR